MAEPRTAESDSDLIEQFIEITERFLRDEESHHPAGFQALAQCRKNLLAQMTGDELAGIDAESRERLKEHLAECEAALEKTARRLQNSVVENLGQIHKTRSVFNKYKSQRRKPSIFIDNLR